MSHENKNEDFSELLKRVENKIIQLYKDSKHKIQLIVSSKEKDYVKRYFTNLLTAKSTLPNDNGENDENDENDDPDAYPLVEFKDIKSGDFWILYNGKLLYLFERKTFVDLSKSLQDGRSATQKFGMDYMPISRARTFLLLEDTQSCAKQMRKYSEDAVTITGTIANWIVKYKRNYLRTIDPGDTVLIILSLLKKAFEFGCDHIEELNNYPSIDHTFDPIKTPFTQIEYSLSQSKEGKNHDDQDANVDADETKNTNTKTNTNINTLNKIQHDFIKSTKKKSGGTVETPAEWYAKCIALLPRMGEGYRPIVNEFPKFKYLTRFLDQVRTPIPTSTSGVDTNIDDQKNKNLQNEILIRLRDLKRHTSSQMEYKQKNEKNRDGKTVKNRNLGAAMAIRLYAWFNDLDESSIKISNARKKTSSSRSSVPKSKTKTKAQVKSKAKQKPKTKSDVKSKSHLKSKIIVSDNESDNDNGDHSDSDRDSKSDSNSHHINKEVKVDDSESEDERIIKKVKTIKSS